MDVALGHAATGYLLYALFTQSRYDRPLEGMSTLIVLFGTQSNLVPALGSSTVGAGVFMSGFLLYSAVWEYGRQRLCRATGPATSAAG